MRTLYSPFFAPRHRECWPWLLSRIDRATKSEDDEPRCGQQGRCHGFPVGVDRSGFLVIPSPLILNTPALNIEYGPQYVGSVTWNICS